MIHERTQRRQGRANPVVVVLLAGVFVALVALIIVILTVGGGGGDQKTTNDGGTVADGQTVSRSELPSPPKKPKPVADPDRIKESLWAGKTYQVVVKFGLDSRVVFESESIVGKLDQVKRKGDLRWLIHL